jgi:hypothetical protein
MAIPFTVTPSSTTPLNTTLAARITATFGPASAQQTQDHSLSVRVAAAPKPTPHRTAAERPDHPPREPLITCGERSRHKLVLRSRLPE